MGYGSPCIGYYFDKDLSEQIKVVSLKYPACFSDIYYHRKNVVSLNDHCAMFIKYCGVWNLDGLLKTISVINKIVDYSIIELIEYTSKGIITEEVITERGFQIKQKQLDTETATVKILPDCEKFVPYGQFISQYMLASFLRLFDLQSYITDENIKRITSKNFLYDNLTDACEINNVMWGDSTRDEYYRDKYQPTGHTFCNLVVKSEYVEYLLNPHIMNYIPVRTGRAYQQTQMNDIIETAQKIKNGHKLEIAKYKEDTPWR